MKGTPNNTNWIFSKASLKEGQTVEVETRIGHKMVGVVGTEKGDVVIRSSGKATHSNEILCWRESNSK